MLSVRFIEMLWEIVPNEVIKCSGKRFSRKLIHKVLSNLKKKIIRLNQCLFLTCDFNVKYTKTAIRYASGKFGRYAIKLVTR